MQPVNTVRRLFPDHAGSKKEVSGVAGLLASVGRWCAGSSRGSGVGGKSQDAAAGRHGWSAPGPEPFS